MIDGERKQKRLRIMYYMQLYKALAGLNQQNQIRPTGIFSTHFVLNCTINDNFAPFAISKKIVALLD